MNLVRRGRAVFLHDHAAGPHLWFVLSGPNNDGRLVAVMLCSLRKHADRTVVLTSADHPFIQHDSCVDYSSATFWARAKIDRHLAAGRAELREDCSAKLLERMIVGACASSRTPNDIRSELGCAPFVSDNIMKSPA